MEQGTVERGTVAQQSVSRPPFPVPCSPVPCSTVPCSTLPCSPVLPGVLVREFTRRQDVVPGSSRALGWDTPSQGSSAGTRLSPRSFGHTGFTGTSIWIDPTRDLVIVILSNRVHPTRDNPRWGPVRGLVADRVALAVDSAAAR